MSAFKKQLYHVEFQDVYLSCHPQSVLHLHVTANPATWTGHPLHLHLTLVNIHHTVVPAQYTVLC